MKEKVLNFLSDFWAKVHLLFKMTLPKLWPFFKKLVSFVKVKWVLILVVALVLYFVLKEKALSCYNNTFRNHNPELHYDGAISDFTGDRNRATCVLRRAKENEINRCISENQGKAETFLCVYDTLSEEDRAKCDKIKK